MYNAGGQKSNVTPLKIALVTQLTNGRKIVLLIFFLHAKSARKNEARGHTF